jgi:hypothetical protein
MDPVAHLIRHALLDIYFVLCHDRRSHRIGWQLDCPEL